MKSLNEIALNGDLITLSNSIFKRDDIEYISIQDLIEIIEGRKEISENPFQKSLPDIINDIRKETNHQIQNKMKQQNLKVFYISGGFIGSCEAENLKCLSKWSCLDIDDYNFCRFNEIIEKLKSLEYISYIFSSPSSVYRLKIIFQHNLNKGNYENIEEYKYYYKQMYCQVCDQVEKLLEIKLDRSCCDVGRANFISYGLIYESEESKPYNFNKTEIESKPESQILPLEEKDILIEECGGNYIKLSFGEFSTKIKQDRTDLDKLMFDDLTKLWKYGVIGSNGSKYYFQVGQRDNFIFYSALQVFSYIKNLDKVIELYSNYLDQNLLFDIDFKKSIKQAYKYKGNKIGDKRSDWLIQFIIKRDNNKFRSH